MSGLCKQQIQKDPPKKCREAVVNQAGIGSQRTYCSIHYQCALPLQNKEGRCQNLRKGDDDYCLEHKKRKIPCGELVREYHDICDKVKPCKTPYDFENIELGKLKQAKNVLSKTHEKISECLGARKNHADKCFALEARSQGHRGQIQKLYTQKIACESIIDKVGADIDKYNIQIQPEQNVGVDDLETQNSYEPSSAQSSASSYATALSSPNNFSKTSSMISSTTLLPPDAHQNNGTASESESDANTWIPTGKGKGKRRSNKSGGSRSKAKKRSMSRSKAKKRSMSRSKAKKRSMSMSKAKKRSMSMSKAKKRSMSRSKAKKHGMSRRRRRTTRRRSVRRKVSKY